MRFCFWVAVLLVVSSSSHAGLLTDWVTYAGSGHEYALWGTGTWQDAYASTPVGSHLVTFANAAEEAWVRGAVESYMEPDWGTWGGVYGRNYRLWVGLTDSEDHGTTEGQWVWITGEPVGYTNWSVGSPDDLFGEDFVESTSLGWNDLGPPQSSWQFCKYAVYEKGIDPPPAVPEPSSIALLALAGGGLGVGLRRRRLGRRP